MNSAGYPDYAISNGTITISINNGTADAFGTYYWLEGEVEGWDAAEMRSSALPKIGMGAAADGETFSDLHYKARQIKMALVMESPSEEARLNSRALLMQVTDLTLDKYPGLFIANEPLPKRLAVYRTVKPTLTDFSFILKAAHMGPQGIPPGEVAWITKAEIELTAPDPRKYAVTPTTVAFTTGVPFVVMDNPGNTESDNLQVTINMNDEADFPGPLGLIVTPGGGTPAWDTGMGLEVPELPAAAPSLGFYPYQLVVDCYAKTILGVALGSAEPGPVNNFYFLRNLQTPWPKVPPDPSGEFSVAWQAPGDHGGDVFSYIPPDCGCAGAQVFLSATGIPPGQGTGSDWQIGGGESPIYDQPLDYPFITLPAFANYPGVSAHRDIRNFTQANDTYEGGGAGDGNPNPGYPIPGVGTALTKPVGYLIYEDTPYLDGVQHIPDGTYLGAAVRDVWYPDSNWGVDVWLVDADGNPQTGVVATPSGESITVWLQSFFWGEVTFTPAWI